MAELEAAARAKRTDELASPLLEEAAKLSRWTTEKTAELKVRADESPSGGRRTFVYFLLPPPWRCSSLLSVPPPFLACSFLSYLLLALSLPPCLSPPPRSSPPPPRFSSCSLSVPLGLSASLRSSFLLAFHGFFPAAQNSAHADKLGGSISETDALLSALEAWCAEEGEKSVKQEEKLKLQEGLADINTRRAQADRAIRPRPANVHCLPLRPCFNCVPRSPPSSLRCSMPQLPSVLHTASLPSPQLP